MTMPRATDEQMNAAEDRAVRLTAALKGRPAVTAVGVTVGTFNGDWDVLRADGTIQLWVDVSPEVAPHPAGGEPYLTPLVLPARGGAFFLCKSGEPTVVEVDRDGQ